MYTHESFSLDLLTTYKENSRLEVKSARGGLPASLWETYSAFANSDGGVIVLGVNEKRHGQLVVEGLDDVHKILKDFWNTVNNRQKVSCNILTDSMVYTDKLEGKNIVVIRVPRAERTSRPVYVGADPRSGTYRRNFEGDYHCSREEVALMIRDSALVTDDNTLLTDLDTSVFCQETVKSYRNIFKLVRPNHLWNREDDTMFLRRIGAVREDKETGKFHPTLAGLLMFGYEYEISAVLPTYFLDYQENRTNGIYARWSDRLTSQSGDWSGNVFDFILKVIPKLQADLKVPFKFKGNFRDEDTPLHKTVREATVNMLANADFYGRRGIVVRKSAEGFLFANPGGMRVSLNEVLRDSASDPRNGVIMKMLAMVQYGERAGSGLQGIFKTWETVYHSSPRLETTTSDGMDRTTLTLAFGERQPDTEAMTTLYADTYPFDETPLTVQESIPEMGYSTQETRESIQGNKGSTQETGGSTQESLTKQANSTQEKGKSTQETKSCTQETKEITQESLTKQANSTQEKGKSTQEIQGSTQETGNSIQESLPKQTDSIRATSFDTRLSNRERIITLLRENPQLTLASIAKTIGLSRDGVKKIANKLRSEGKLAREGSTKSGKWIVKD